MMFPYKKVAVFGATSGIGRALAERFIENGIFVVLIGRRKERLDALVEKHGRDKTEARVFDITKMDQVENFAADLTRKHGDLDLAFFNSGIQRPMSFAKPEAVDMKNIQDEFVTNYLSQVALTKAFLPHFMLRAAEGKSASVCFTTSALALVPNPRVANYSATKAAMHSFILTLREEIGASGVKVLEVLPPMVQTELHGEHGTHMGMPLAEYTDKTWDLLQQGRDQVPVGMSQLAFDAFETKRQEVFHQLFGQHRST